ncbi:MAG: AEC family transporter [Pseudomonadota bacterium]
MIAEVFTVAAPVIILTLIGYLWARANQPFDNDTASSIVMMIGSPCLVFSALTSIEIDFNTFGIMAFSAALLIAISGGLGLLCLHLLNKPAHTFLPALMHQNSGNMGLPLVLLAFGEPGLALGVTCFFVNSISQYSIGISITSGKSNFASLARQPIIYSVFIVIPVIAFDIPIPRWIAGTTELLGGLAIPLMLLLLGNSLARLEISDLPLALGLAVLRLALGITSGVAVIWLLGLEGMQAGVILLLACMPSAVFNFVFAERFQRSPEKVAGLVMSSTILSLCTLPILVWVTLRVAAT